MDTIHADVAKVRSKATVLESTEAAVLASIIGRLEEIQHRLASGTTTLQAALPGLSTSVQNGSARLTDAIKDVHSPLNKLGKGIDKARLLSSALVGLELIQEIV